MPIKTPTNNQALAPKAAGAVAKKGKTVKDWLDDAAFQNQIAAALPKFLNTDHFIRSALTEFRMNPDLQKCSVPSVLGYFMQAAACGLEPASVLGQCYAVPFKNTKAGTMEATFLLGYRGMLSIARRSGEVASVDAQIVHEKDEFSVEYGLAPNLVHKPYLEGDPGPMKGAYVVVRFKGEGVEPLMKYMPKHEIDAHRRRSRASGSGPWMTDYESMALKTVFRSVFKWLPVSIEQVMATTGDGAVAKFNSNATDPDDALEIEFVTATDDGGSAETNVTEAVDAIAEQMSMDGEKGE